MKFNRNLIIAAALSVTAIVMAGCGSTTNVAVNTATSNRANMAPANTTTTTNTAPANTTASTADSVGVPECDEYIKKYEACLTNIAAKAPAAQGPMKSAFEAQRSSFKTAAATPQGKATLASACKSAMETAKTATAAYACTW